MSIRTDSHVTDMRRVSRATAKAREFLRAGDDERRQRGHSDRLAAAHVADFFERAATPLTLTPRLHYSRTIMLQ